MEVRCKENWPYCETCKSCMGFQKILELKTTGLVMYRHTNRLDEVNETNELKSSLNMKNDVFIIHNTKDTQIKADECISEIDQSISCARCREIIKRAKKYLQAVPPIDKNDIISICDHCQQNIMKKKTLNYCCKCHEVLKKYHAEQDKLSTAQEQIKSWLNKIHKLFENVKSDKKTLKYRSYSELYLNNIGRRPVTASRTARHLEVRPMHEKGIRMTDLTNSLNSDTKSESAIKFTESEHNKSKSVLFRAESRSQIESYVSPSITTYDMSLVSKPPITNEERKSILQRDAEMAQKIKIEPDKSALTKRKYSSEDVFYSAVGLTDSMVKNFSYIFPKERKDATGPLRRVKSSAELILDTQEMLRQRAMTTDDKNKQKVYSEKVLTGVKRTIASDDGDSKKRLKKKRSDGEKSPRPRSKKPTTDGEDKSDKEKVQNDQKQKKETELRTKEKGESQKEKQERLRKEKEEKQKEKQEQLRREKEEKQREKEEKQREKEEKQREKEEKQREKEEKQREKEEKQKDKQEQLRKEKEEKQRLKEEQQKLKEEKIKNKKSDEQSHQKLESTNVKTQQDIENPKLKMESDKKKKEDAKQILKSLEENKIEKNVNPEKPKINKTQEEPTNKELNIKQIKMKMQSTDDLILQLVRLRQSLKMDDKARPKRLSDFNITPLMYNEHKKIHKNKKMHNCLMCCDSDLELDVENIVSEKNKPEINDVIVGNKILKSKQPLHETTQVTEIIPMLYKSLYKEEMMSVEHKEHAENVTRKDHKTMPPVARKYVSTYAPFPNIFVVYCV